MPHHTLPHFSSSQNRWHCQQSKHLLREENTLDAGVGARFGEEKDIAQFVSILSHQYSSMSLVRQIHQHLVQGINSQLGNRGSITVRESYPHATSFNTMDRSYQTVLEELRNSETEALRQV